ncbi:Uncharacterised protein [uncultured archaeon]|nr:Uncharacterised protein [uncultured archaeon]
MGRCFRCKVEFSSGMLHHGHEYCTTCYLRITQDEAAKKRREETMKRMRDDARRKAATEITRRQHAPAVPQAKPLPPKAKPKHAVHRFGHITPAHSSPALPHHPSHAPAHGLSYGTVAKVQQTVAGQHALRPGKKETSHRQQHGFFAGSSESSPKLSLEALSGLPEALQRGQNGVTLLFKGLNMNAKPSSVTLEVHITDSKGKKIAPSLSPEKCTLEAIGEGKFSAAFDIPADAATGALKLTAVLRENAYHIDPSMGRSNKLELASQIK